MDDGADPTNVAVGRHLATIDVYEARATDWKRARHPGRQHLAHKLRTEANNAVRPVAVVADLGCGPGQHLGDLGQPTVALDASLAMLRLARASAGHAALVVGDLAELPFGRSTLAGGWASKSYVHLPQSQVPLALRELHRVLQVGAPATLVVFEGTTEFAPFPGDDFPGRSFSSWPQQRFRDVLTGAGFTIERFSTDPPTAVGGTASIVAEVRRAESLSDTVLPAMSLLVCGVNPSPTSAATGVGYAKPGNRFWPAALAAGLVSRDRDPLHALKSHGVGMTDLVRRTTRRADELSEAEVQAGMQRVGRLIEWMQPEAVCFTGLSGYRSAVDPKAKAGWQTSSIGGAPTYLMPSTSGLNAHSQIPDLAEHFRAAMAGPPDGG